MLDDAISTLNNREHPIVHSDRGGHYRWPGWIGRMTSSGLIRSMSKKGCSLDNSACEGFFEPLNRRYFYNGNWTNVSTQVYIKYLNIYLIWFSEVRIKESLVWLNHIQYRRTLGLTI